MRPSPLLPLLLLLLLPPSALAGLNCGASALCIGHNIQRMRDIVTSISTQSPTSQFSTSGPETKQHLACSLWHNMRGVCGFYQYTAGATFTQPRTETLAHALLEEGKCKKPCGSIPVNWPQNNETGGIFTVNAVTNAACPEGGNCAFSDPIGALTPAEANGAFANGTCSVWVIRTTRVFLNPFLFDVYVKDSAGRLMGEATQVKVPVGGGFDVKVDQLTEPIKFAVKGKGIDDPVGYSYAGKSYDTGNPAQPWVVDHDVKGNSFPFDC